MGKSQIKISVMTRISPMEVAGREPVYTLKGSKKEICLMDPRSVVIEHNFEFHYVHPPVDTNAEVFTECCKPMLDQVMEGCNGCFLVYGQRKSGKSLTVFGEDESATMGMIEMTLDCLVEATKAENPISISMQFVDIAQDRIRDLGQVWMPDFNPKDAACIQRLHHEEVPLEDETGVYGIPTATPIPVTSAKEALATIRKGLEFRKEEETMLNPVPLMHTLVVLTILRPFDPIHPKVTLVFGDLARSEKSRKDTVSIDQINSQHINSVHGSFVSLCRVLEGLSKQTEDKDLIIPYRECKLTAVLSKCFNSACSFVFIACITPVPQLFDDTVNVLEYAGKLKSLARDVVLLPKDVYDEGRLKEMRMKKLRDDINDLKSQLEEFEFLHGKRLKDLSLKLGLDFDLENLTLDDPYSREALAVRNLKEAMEKADTLKHRRDEMQIKLEEQKEILSEVKLVAINNQEKQLRELQEYQVQINQLTSKLNNTEQEAVAGLPKEETEVTEELQKLLYHGHLLIEEQSAEVNNIYKVTETRAGWGETNTEEREAGRNTVENLCRTNFRNNEKDLKILALKLEKQYEEYLSNHVKVMLKSECDFKAYCRLKMEAVRRYESECIALLEVAQQQQLLIENIRRGDYNNGIVPVLIPRSHLPPELDAVRFKQYQLIRHFQSSCFTHTLTQSQTHRAETRNPRPVFQWQSVHSRGNCCEQSRWKTVARQTKTSC